MDEIFIKNSQPLADDLDDYLDVLETKKKKRIINRPPKESDSILTLAERCYMGIWDGLFNDTLEDLRDISDFIEIDESNHGKCYPDRSNIFRIFSELPLRKVKVVILGQDPYHQLLSSGYPRAQGLSFSVSKEDAIPSSLKNIFKEIKSNCTDVGDFEHGDLTCWLNQGVLLLNAALTVRPGVAGSHSNRWLSFLSVVFEKLSQSNNKIVYMLWGNHAKSFRKKIRSKKCLILESAHPSGLSANRGFFGNGHFEKANDFLDDPIDWSVN